MKSTLPLLTVAAVFATCAVLAQIDDSVPFPTGYRQWVHIATVYRGAKNAVFQQQPCTKPCSGGVFEYFANAKALEGYRTGKFPDGAIIADEFIEMQEAPQQPETGVLLQISGRGGGDGNPQVIATRRCRRSCG